MLLLYLYIILHGIKWISCTKRNIYRVYTRLFHRRDDDISKKWPGIKLRFSLIIALQTKHFAWRKSNLKWKLNKIKLQTTLWQFPQNLFIRKFFNPFACGVGEEFKIVKCKIQLFKLHSSSYSSLLFRFSSTSSALTTNHINCFLLTHA